MLTYAIADIHGMYRMLLALLQAISADAAGRPYRLVFLGDYVDRGPESRKVIDLIRKGVDDPACVETILLQGNHDRMLFEYVLRTGYSGEYWIDNGGHTVVREYEERHRDPALVEDAMFLRDATRLNFVDEMGRIFVHAGLVPDVPLARQDEEAMQWIREGFLDNEMDHGGLVVHGHTIVRTGYPKVARNRIGLDTGAFVEGGALTSARFEDGSVWPTGFLRLPHGGSVSDVEILGFDPPSGNLHPWAIRG